MTGTVVDMSTFDWVMVGVAVLLFGIYGNLGAPGIWRGKSPTLCRWDPPRWWLWGGSLWRGLCRGTPAIAVIGLNAALAAVVLAGLMSRDSSGIWIVYLLTYLTLLAFVVLWPAITLFARPKFLIPPHLRDQPGALSEWWGAFRKRVGRDPGHPRLRG